MYECIFWHFFALFIMNEQFQQLHIGINYFSAKIQIRDFCWSYKMLIYQIKDIYISNKLKMIFVSLFQCDELQKNVGTHAQKNLHCSRHTKLSLSIIKLVKAIE